MHIRLLAVGDRQPAWVDEAFGIYTERFPREWKFRVDLIATVTEWTDAAREMIAERTDIPDVERPNKGPSKSAAATEAAQLAVTADCDRFNRSAVRVRLPSCATAQK